MIQAHLPVVRELLKEIDQGSFVLEAGCGMGQWVSYADSFSHTAVGIDVVKETLRKAQTWHSNENASFKGSFISGDIRSLPFRSACFDLVLSFGVIEHFSDPRPLLKEIHRVLKPGGKALITTPNIYCTHTFMRPFLQWIGKWHLGYEDSYSPQQLRMLLEDTDYSVDSFGIMPSGEIFGTAPRYIPLIGPIIYSSLRRISFSIEKKTNIFGFWSYAIGGV